MTLCAASLLVGCISKDRQPPPDGSGSSDTATDTGGTASGVVLYQTNCAECHGALGRGIKDVGTDLLPEFNRHDDLFLADVILNGKGDMDAVPVSDEEATLIVAWLRELFAG